MYSVWCELEPGHAQRREFIEASAERGFVTTHETAYPLAARAHARCISANDQTMCYVRHTVYYPEVDHEQVETLAIFQNGGEIMMDDWGSSFD